MRPKVSHILCLLTVLFMTFIPMPSAYADDHGDDCATATTVNINSTTAGDIDPAGDWDYFQVDIAGTGDLTVYSTGWTDTYGYLLDSTCTVITENDDSGWWRNFRIRSTLNAGTYYIAVKHYRADRTGSYTLHVNFSGDDHGNDCASATVVTCASTTSGDIHVAGDWDYFQLDLANAAIVNIYTTGSTDTYGYLYDSGCSEIVHDNDSGSSRNFRIDQTLNAGTYYVAVRHYRSNRTGSYTLNIDCTVFYTITSSAAAGGTISPSGATTISQGGSQIYSITPNTGNSVADVLVDGASVGAVNSYTFSNVTSDHTIAATFTVPPESCIDISDTPLDVRRHGAPANVMFVIDDSGSMDWEFMTNENDGVFEGNEYLFDMTDNIYKTGTYSHVLSGSDRLKWKSQWAGYNKMYYNPSTDYAPWPTYADADPDNPRSHPGEGSVTLNLSDTYTTATQVGTIVDNQDSNFSMTGNWSFFTHTEAYKDHYYFTPSDGDYTATWTPNLTAGQYQVYARWRALDNRSTSVPYTITHAGVSTTVSINQRNNGGLWNLLGTYDFNGDPSEKVSITYTRNGDNDRVCADAVKFVSTAGASLNIINAHYYVWSVQEGKPYLVMLDGAITYYAVNDGDSDDLIESGEWYPTNSPPADVQSSRTYAQERQNFANWFSYYRRRELTATDAMAEVISNMQGVQVGFRSINGGLISPALKIKVGGVDETGTLLNDLYSFGLNLGRNSTPLRAGLREVGEYIDQTDSSDGGVGPSPIATAAEGGECQQNFAVVMTDGHYNGGAPGFSNEDGDNGVPYADSYPDTLADVAMYYYENDLSTLDNLVPPNPFDDATHQHMVTYGITFGVHGTLNPDDYDLENGPYPVWPNINAGNNDNHKIDDLWHSTVNGRGLFLSASNPNELVAAFLTVMQDIESRVGSASSVSINGDELYEKLSGSIQMYQATYMSDNWSGDVKAHQVTSGTGEVVTSSYLWSAAEELKNKTWSNRIIATSDGSPNTGKAFLFDNLTATQKDLLDQTWAADDTNARNLLKFLRGDHTNEELNGGSFRNRNQELGDIVHSSPVYEDGALYVGGNDGMLHAFDASNGTELFAYVPNLVFANLKDLADPNYSHKFFVDLTPTVKSGVTISGSQETLLVGGLGRGGKGYYALEVTNPSSIDSEVTLAGRVLWEYPSTPGSDADMGYSYSRPMIIESNDTNIGWIVVFGNGYNSQNGHAVLYILNPSNGSVLKKIDTGVGSCNGMSTPLAVDKDDDQKADYVYAGDLKGNMWKFDLTDPNYANWDVAYKSGGTTPEPVFQAEGPGGITQPITTQADAMFHCEKDGIMVVFATGSYLGNFDFSDTSVQTIYGIWDYGDDGDNDEYLGSFNRGATPELSNQPATVTLLQQVEVDWRTECGKNLRTLSDNVPTWETEADTDQDELPNPSSSTANHAGWYFDLPISGERVASDVLIREGRAIVISFTPESTPCGTGGDSIVHEMDACAGGRLDEPVFDINDDGVIDSQDLINIGTVNNPIMVPPTGIQIAGRVLPPSILIVEDEEIKYFSSSRGTIETVTEKAATTGIYYWMEFSQ